MFITSSRNSFQFYTSAAAIAVFCSFLPYGALSQPNDSSGHIYGIVSNRTNADLVEIAKSTGHKTRIGPLFASEALAQQVATFDSTRGIFYALVSLEISSCYFLAEYPH